MQIALGCGTELVGSRPYASIGELGSIVFQNFQGLFGTACVQRKDQLNKMLMIRAN